MKNYLMVLLLSLLLSGLSSCSNNNVKEEITTQAPVTTDTAKPTPVASQQIHLNDKYCNNRYGFCIAFPNEILTMEHESASGDGTSFDVGDYIDFLIVFGRTNPDPAAGKFNMKKELDHEINEFLKDSIRDHSTVTYATSGKDFYVFSGIKDDKIFYQKGITKGDDLAIAIFQYKKEQKEKFDVIVTAMAKTFD